MKRREEGFEKKKDLKRREEGFEKKSGSEELMKRFDKQTIGSRKTGIPFFLLSFRLFNHSSKNRPCIPETFNVGGAFKVGGVS